MNFESVLADQRFILGEGPHYDRDRHLLYWVDIVAGRAWALDTRLGRTRSWAIGEPVSAIVPRRGGGLLVAHKSGLSFLDPESGALTPFVAPEAGLAGNRSNEARVDPTGRFWLGTMQDNIGPNGEDLPIDQTTGSLYRIEPDGAYRRVETGIAISNTLAWDEKRARLYFADSAANTIWVYDWNSRDGEIGNRRLFAQTADRGVPDGSALDTDGFLWNARWGGSCIIRYDPDGKIDRIVETPVRQPTSCVFGGEALRTLYVTSAKVGLDGGLGALDGALLAADAPMAGQPCVPFAG